MGIRTKTIELKASNLSTGRIGIGSIAETDWAVKKITFIGIVEDEITIICDCVHVEDFVSEYQECIGCNWPVEENTCTNPNCAFWEDSE